MSLRSNWEVRPTIFDLILPQSVTKIKNIVVWSLLRGSAHLCFISRTFFRHKIENHIGKSTKKQSVSRISGFCNSILATAVMDWCPVIKSIHLWLSVVWKTNKFLEAQESVVIPTRSGEVNENRRSSNDPRYLRKPSKTRAKSFLSFNDSPNLSLLDTKWTCVRQMK